jgi:ankyrin repeat protein
LKDNNGRAPLSYAAQSGQNDAVSLLLEKGAEADSRDKDGRTPLSYAVGGYLSPRGKIIQLLLQKNAQVNSMDKYGRTPLSYVAETGQVDVVQPLLQRSSPDDLKLEDKKGRTPLMYAAARRHRDIEQLLLSHFKA